MASNDPNTPGSGDAVFRSRDLSEWARRRNKNLLESLANPSFPTYSGRLQFDEQTREFVIEGQGDSPPTTRFRGNAAIPELSLLAMVGERVVFAIHSEKREVAFICLDRDDD